MRLAIHSLITKRIDVEHSMSKVLNFVCCCNIFNEATDFLLDTIVT